MLNSYAKKLKAVGFTEQQAEVQTEMLAEIINEKLATKEDMAALKNDLHKDIQQVKSDLTIRMGSMLFAAVTVLGILMKIL